MPKVKVTDAKGLVQEAGSGVEISSRIRCKNGAGLKDAKLFRAPGTGDATPTNISATELSVNTHYKSVAGATAMTIPSAATCSVGDFITVFYGTAITNGQSHTYTVHADDASFAAGSTATRIGGAVASAGAIANGTNHNVLTIAGHTNGDGGVGTIVQLVCMKASAGGWAVKAVTTNQGAGSQAGTIAFS